MHSTILGVALACALISSACGTSDTTGDNTDLTPPTQVRTASLDFSNSASVYLLSVYSTPGVSEASSASDLQYDITPGTATAGLSLTRLEAQSATVNTNQAFWDARIAFESARRSEIDAFTAGMVDRGEVFTQREALTASCTCSATQTCVAGSTDCVGQVSWTLGGAQQTLYVVGTDTSQSNVHVTVVSDNQADVSAPASLMAIATELAAAAAKDLRVIGQADHSGVLDVDGNGSVTVAFTSNFGNLDSSIIGAFVFGDYLTPGTASATGNHADILWARAPSASAPEALLIGTLAHEYQHLVSFALRSKLGDPTAVREVLWLDEGISHTMEDLTGWGGSTVDAFSEALLAWDNTPFAGPNDSVAQRGRAYMMIRYLIDAKARANGATDAKADKVLDAAHDVLAPLYGQTRRGFQHQLFQDARSSGQILAAVRAVYTTGNVDVTAVATNTNYLPTASSPNANGQLIGFNPFGQYVSAQGQAVPLGGPKLDDSNSTGITAAISDSIPDSGARFYVVTGGSGTVNLTMTADNNVDIDLDAIKVK